MLTVRREDCSLAAACRLARCTFPSHSASAADLSVDMNRALFPNATLSSFTQCITSSVLFRMHENTLGQLSENMSIQSILCPSDSHANPVLPITIPLLASSSTSLLDQSARSASFESTLSSILHTSRSKMSAPPPLFVDTNLRWKSSFLGPCNDRRYDHD